MAADRSTAELERFLAERADHLLRTAVLLTGSREAGEDLLQTAVERLLRRWRRFDGDPEGYLRRTLCNLATDGYRRAGRWRQKERLLRTGVRHAPDATGDVDLRDALVRLLWQLPVRQRAVLVLRYWEQLTDAETAAILGCAEGTVKSAGVLGSPMDSMAFIGFPIAEQYFAFDGHPTELYVRADPTQVNAVYNVLQATVDPASPADVQVNELSTILQAEVLTKGAYNTLFLGLGAVALLVGGVGVANVMVISVLERRSEIGLRRALGATRRHVAAQFLAEALLLSALGGLAGTVIGVMVTAIYAHTQHIQVLIPLLSLYGGIGAALAIGAIAGLYPAMRAARLSPTEALRTV